MAPKRKRKAQKQCEVCIYGIQMMMDLIIL